ncbi:hypothetical protein, partial [Vibrio cyclitrophicus]|uniref:hypothetical protein n=5 Tax=Vibrio cyclitrophicus TaxID=47951 RepID=UPI001A7E199B
MKKLDNCVRAFDCKYSLIRNKLNFSSKITRKKLPIEIKILKSVHKKSSQLVRVFTSESQPYIIRAIGGMAEWSKAPVLK